MRAENALWPWVALRMVPGIRVRLYHELLRCFGEPAAAFAASESQLETAGVPRQAARAIASSLPRQAAERELAGHPADAGEPFQTSRRHPGPAAGLLIAHALLSGSPSSPTS